MVRALCSLALAALALAGCATSDVGVTFDVREFGPLALALGENGDNARTEGVLEITGTCVFLTNQNRRTLLIWPSAQTRWDAASQTILVNDRDGQAHRLAHGQRVAFGGSGGGAGEGREPPGRLDRIPWVVQPMPECVVPEYWFVGEVAAS
jgi:hypothetical protein